MLCLWLEVELVNSLDFTWFSVFCEKRNAGILVCMCGFASRGTNLYATLQSFKKNRADVRGLCAAIFPYTEKGNELRAKK